MVAADMKTAEQTMLDQRVKRRLARRMALVFAIASLLLAGTPGWSPPPSITASGRREALEREMSARLRAESSMQSATWELLRSERINRSILDTSGDCIQILVPRRPVSMNRAGARSMEVEDEMDSPAGRGSISGVRARRGRQRHWTMR